MTIRTELESRLLALPLLSRWKSRFGDSHAYFVSDREIAHFHGDERMDVRLTKERIRELKAKGPLDPRIRTRGPSAEWAAVRISGEVDIALAVELVEEAIHANS